MELKITQLVSILSFLLYLASPSHSNPDYDDLVQCLPQKNSPPFNPISSIIHTTPSKYSYSSLLQSTIQKNQWFSILEKPNPLAIIPPMIDYYVQAAITCYRKHKLFGGQMNQIPELDLPSPDIQLKTNFSSKFLQCFQSKTNLSISNSSSGVIFTPSSPSYYSILLSSADNLRFTTNSTPKPEIIIRPLDESHIQAAVACAEESEINVRTRSGGHDYEGLSYVSHIPFILVDLSDLRSIKIDLKNKIAWVGAGATLGELYHAIAEESQAYGFPAGTCPTVGVGGHFSGGGVGTLCRKYGLAADNIDDARMVDAKGRVLDRKSMGEGPFWAIRGGGGASFGIIFSWKVKLVPVPTTVTVFLIERSLEQGATKLVHKWQIIGNRFSKDLFIRLVIEAADSASGSSNKTIIVSFAAVFFGPSEQLLTTMEEDFPELGVAKTDCFEMSWIQSVLYVANFPFDGSDEVLLDRINRNKTYFKAKSDYVEEPMLEEGLEGLWKILLEEESGYMIWTPYGGIMSEIPTYEIPFPHRNGNLYEIQYVVTWQEKEGTEEPVNWIRSLYAYMTPFVSKNPRSSYLNYRDLDLGFNRNRNESYGQASVWGLKYFKSNFKRLAHIKAEFDPSNFFWYEQSIPLLL